MARAILLALALLLSNYLGAKTVISGIWGEQSFEIQDVDGERKLLVKSGGDHPKILFEKGVDGYPLSAYSPGDASPFLVLVYGGGTSYKVRVFTASGSNYEESEECSSYTYPELIESNGGGSSFLVASYGDGHAAKVSSWKSKIFELNPVTKKVRIHTIPYKSRLRFIERLASISGDKK